MLRGWRAGSIAIAISLCTSPASAAGASRVIQLAQAVPDADRGGASSPATAPANSPEQIRKAQTELRRLDCLQGRIDGKLGEQTRRALKKFWASAKEPASDVNITDELIAVLAEHGDNFCRPPRPFFAIGGRTGGKPGLPPFFPGARTVPVPAPAAAPAAPEPAQ
jgi:peptidoglycan hydrolase-like protein with peptidoglycan-binding domain